MAQIDDVLIERTLTQSRRTLIKTASASAASGLELYSSSLGILPRLSTFLYGCLSRGSSGRTPDMAAFMRPSGAPPLATRVAVPPRWLFRFSPLGGRPDVSGNALSEVPRRASRSFL